LSARRNRRDHAVRGGVDHGGRTGIRVRHVGTRAVSRDRDPGRGRPGGDGPPGRYDAAIADYERARAIDREAGDGDGETTRLNNIGNVHFMRGRYGDALQLYEEALKAAETRASQRSRGRLRKMTTSNLAALYQRLGADGRALDLSATLRAGETMATNEEAQLLVNQGALLRRLGDPVKAMATYREAQALFARDQHRDGEIGAWRNIGIVYALELNDYPRALEACEGTQAPRSPHCSDREHRGHLGSTLNDWGPDSETIRSAASNAATSQRAGHRPASAPRAPAIV
jgi:hypothetical protein